MPRTNVIVALGSHETISDGAGNDQLGASLRLLVARVRARLPMPGRHPCLLIHDTAPPFGTAIPNAVIVENLAPVGASIPVRTNSGKYALVTRLGSATNWTVDPQSYRVLLQCTSNINNGWKFGCGTDF